MAEQENDAPSDAQDKADSAERTSGQDTAARAGEKAQRKADDAEKRADGAPHRGDASGEDC